MSLLPARKLIETAFTAAAVNAQIDTLNTLYTKAVAHLATVKNSMETEPSNMLTTDFPALLYHVAMTAGAGEIKSQGKRDDHVSVVLTYLGHEAQPSDAEDAADLIAEALRPIVETLDSQPYGSTHRYCVEVQNLIADVARFDVGGSVYRIGSRVKFTMLMRTEGL